MGRVKVTEKKPAKQKAKAKKAQKDKEEVEEEETTTTTASVPATDFTVPAVQGSQIKIISWNVAGFNAVLNKGFKDYVEKENPDIICLQETKIAEEAPATNLFGDKYHKYFYAAISPNSGYAGTGLYSKIKPIAVTKGIGIEKHDKEGRCLTAEYDTFFLVTTYIPNSGQKLQNLNYRTQEWDVDFLAYLKKLEKTKPVIWCGDTNVAHKEIDLENPKTNKNRAGFTQAERDNFTKLLDSGFIDTFRHFKPDEKKAYTFWTYLKNARAKDAGWRLDYFIVSNVLLLHVKASYIRKYIMGSDHAPIGLIFDPPTTVLPISQ